MAPAAAVERRRGARASSRSSASPSRARSMRASASAWASAWATRSASGRGSRWGMRWARRTGTRRPMRTGTRRPTPMRRVMPTARRRSKPRTRGSDRDPRPRPAARRRRRRAARARRHPGGARVDPGPAVAGGVGQVDMLRTVRARAWRRPWVGGTSRRAAVVPAWPVRYGAVRDPDLSRPRRVRHGRLDEAVGRRAARPRASRRTPLELPKRKAEDAVAAFEAQVPDEPGVVVGGHSFGGRVASLAVAGVRVAGAAPRAHAYAALVCLSYPLHPPGAARERRRAHRALARDRRSRPCSCRGRRTRSRGSSSSRPRCPPLRGARS